jgi:hypothetical protein
MKLRYAVIAVVAVITIPTASAASLSLTSQNLTPIRTCILSGYPSTDTSELDSMVEQTNPTTGYGSNVHIEIETHTTTNIRTYIEFVVTTCAPKPPSTATVLGATLRLYATTLPATCRNEDIFPVTSSWTEAGITWNNQPFGTTLNNPASGYTAQMQVGTTCTTNKAVGYVTGWAVTSDVQKFVAGSATNYGWMIRDDVEGSATAYTTIYEAKDGNSATEDPQLVISWKGA